MERLIRMTRTVRTVMGVVLDGETYGLRISRITGLGAGTVYPILQRLVDAGWLESKWEAEPPGDRPPRRLYQVTGLGRSQLEAKRPLPAPAPSLAPAGLELTT